MADCTVRHRNRQKLFSHGLFELKSTPYQLHTIKQVVLQSYGTSYIHSLQDVRRALHETVASLENAESTFFHTRDISLGLPI